jgi:hypothetical protein
MATLAFGQPLRAICQVGYVVPDLPAAIRGYAEVLRIGPWFVAENFAPQSQRYRGQPTNVDVSIATAYSGSAMIELIQQHDDGPSVYRAQIDAEEYGFHHWAITTDDFAADADAYRDRGYEPSFEVVMPTLFDSARVAYYDTTADLPGMVELIELNHHVERFLATMKKAAETWDGRALTAPLPAPG